MARFGLIHFNVACEKNPHGSQNSFGDSFKHIIMSTAGIYEEPLPCGGKMRVTKASWEIRYYFPGPDMRYNGTVVTIQGRLIQQFIDAYMENWSEYEKLKAVIPRGGDFSKDGKMGMSIRVGSFSDGVCICSYHMPINSQKQLTQILDGYRYAAKRAPEIQEFLAAL